MKTLRRYVHREILTAVAFVTLGFLALFFFFDFVDELRRVNRDDGGYRLQHALLYVLLSVPTHLYELLPITVLIGTIFVMARLAQSSEFTIMRTSGLGPWRALRTLLALGAGFVVLTSVIGDYVAPLSDRMGQLVRAQHLREITKGATGAWLKERQGDHSVAVNVRSIDGNADMRDVRIFTFDPQGRLRTRIHAASAHLRTDGTWELHTAHQTVLPPALDLSNGASSQPIPESAIAVTQHDVLEWKSNITGDMVAAAVINPDRMSTYGLFNYIRHLEANGQSAQRYEIEFWRKVFYPLSCLVMMVLALPFAYLHFRSGGIAGAVFGGVMAGISFFLLNNVFGYAGNLQQWSPLLTAAAPGLIYSLLSLGAFTWLVLRR